MRKLFTVAAVLMFICVSLATGGSRVEKSLTNSIGMEFVRIEPGSFMMGSGNGGDWDEMPVHKVRITRGFSIGATEVTNAQYERFDPSHRKLRGKRGISSDDDEAVVFVSWYDAVRFCEWLSKKEGKSYRLPTEAEWEYACRAGTSTAYYTGDKLDEVYYKHQKQECEPVPVKLYVGGTPANPWSLYDMHGNVEEWCYDWYGPYAGFEQVDPVGCADGDFKVTRSGSYATPVVYLRSANRMGTLPRDKHWLIGFRVVLGELPKTAPLPMPAPPRWGQRVSQRRYDFPDAPDASKPWFRGPLQYVNIPPDSNGPMFSHHNHQPGLTACPNGDLLAVWYSTISEKGRELGVVAARLRAGSDEWDPAAPFWNAPDRNDHGSAVWWDGSATIYHFNGLDTDGTWGKLALIMRTSSDNGATWSKARIINAEHGLRNQVIAGVFRTKRGSIIVACDADTGGNGGTAIHISNDSGKTWVDPGANRPKPEFEAGRSGAYIAGIHAGVVELKDGRLMALGRGDAIDGQMPKSISSDMGRTWTYSASGLPPIGGGQRLVLRRLREGPLLFVSFAGQKIADASGRMREVSGMFGALSFDEGETWPIRRLITDDGPPRRIDGDSNTDFFTLSRTTAEPHGYLACTQTQDGIIHLITSRQYYAFNLAWLKQPMPAEKKQSE